MAVVDETGDKILLGRNVRGPSHTRRLCAVSLTLLTVMHLFVGPLAEEVAREVLLVSVGVHRARGIL